MQRKYHRTKSNYSMHPAARFVIKYGTIFSLLILLAGCFWPKASFYAISFCQSAVYSFSVSVIGGLLLDIIAFRLGKRE